MLALILAAAFVDLAGSPVKPDAFSESKATGWIFIATDCPVSNGYAGEINRLQAAYSGKARIFLIYSDPSTSRADAATHHSAYSLKSPGILDAKQTLMHEAKAEKTPEAVVFNSKGRIVYKGRIDNRWARLGVSRGTATTHEFRDALDAAIAGRMPKVQRAPEVGCYIPRP